MKLHWTKDAFVKKKKKPHSICVVAVIIAFALIEGKIEN